MKPISIGKLRGFQQISSKRGTFTALAGQARTNIGRLNANGTLDTDHRSDVEAAFRSPAARRLHSLIDALKTKFGYVVGDVNWAGVLNLALDLRGQAIFLDMEDRPEEVRIYFNNIAAVLERFTAGIAHETGTTSISVNRAVRHIAEPVFLHSECALTMISTAHYEAFLRPIDADWSLRRRPFGVHYCGADPHRYAEALAGLPHLDFLDVGWGGDVAALRAKLPRTFLNLRLSPVEIVDWSPARIHAILVDAVTGRPLEGQIVEVVFEGTFPRAGPPAAAVPGIGPSGSGRADDVQHRLSPAQ